MARSKKDAQYVLKQALLFSLIIIGASCKSELPTEDNTRDISSEENIVDGPSEAPKDPEKESEEESETIPETALISSYLDIAAINGDLIDSYYSKRELLKARTLKNVDQVDTCSETKNVSANDTFSDQIHYYTELMLSPVPAKVGVIGSYYSSPSNDNSYHPVSLVSHPLCIVSSSTLSQTLKKVPSSAVIEKINRFSSSINALREKIIKKTGEISESEKEEAHDELIKKWGKLFSCLAYTESLSSADSSSSISVASSSAPSGYSRPSGVEFYNDPAQDAASRLNIGLFQFTPNSGGNIKSCLLAWNAIHENTSSCKINASGNKAEMIKILGSSYQSFNAFCGIHKLVQTFAIQVNTTGSSATFPGNSSKSKENRCVSPYFYAGKAYNHFGPLQNSTGSNMDKLFTCLEKA